MSKNNRGVLGAHVLSLSVHGGRIMEGVEEFYKFFVSYFGSIELNVGYFDVSCLSRAYLFVGGVWSSVWI